MRLDAVRPQQWMDNAVCAQVDADLWFPETGGNAALARRICSTCPVAADCLQYAVEHNEQGIWGGTSAKTRQRMRGTEQPCA